MQKKLLRGPGAVPQGHPLLNACKLPAKASRAFVRNRC
jgi:hypothetical protein